MSSAPGAGRCARSWLAVALALGLLPAGCATVAGGARDQRVKITSAPPGATVLVDGNPAGTTPAVVHLDRHTEHRVEVELSGYQPHCTVLKPGVNPWIIGNILVGGIVGVIIDVCADADNRLFPGAVTVRLCPQVAPAGPPESAGPLPAATPQ